MLSELKNIRESNGLTINEMAKKLEISKGYYSMIENGKRGLSYPLAVRIARVFGKKPDEIFFNNEFTNEKLIDCKEKEVS